MHFKHFGKSDIGPKRKINQDSLGMTQKKWGSLFVVSDGFGHEKGGLFASRYAVDTLIEEFSRTEPDNVKKFFSDTFKKINKYIYYNKVSAYDKAMMGCTTVAIIIEGNILHIAHIGDSRAYLLRNNELIQLTKDHSYIQTLLDEKGITLEDAKHHPKRHVLTRALGSHKRIVPGYRQIEIKLDDKFVLCSDGVWGFITEDTLKNIINDNEPQNAVESVIDNIKNNNGLDNITLELLHFEK